LLLVPCKFQPKSQPIFAVRNGTRRLLAAALVILLTGSARALDVTTSALRCDGWDCAQEKSGAIVGLLAFTGGDYLLCGGFALALTGVVCLLWRRQIQCQQRALQKLRDEVQDEARQRMADLAKSVSALNAALESTADGLLVVDLEGRVVSYNRKFLQMWRIPPEKTASGRDDELIEIAMEQVKDRTTVLKRIRELYAQPEVECCELVEFKDGRILERYSIPQRMGGKIVGRVWSFRDVTEQKRIEREMAESRNFLDRIINSIGDPIQVKDRQHRWVLVNDAACSLLGLARRDILGKTEREIFPRAEAEAIWETDERVFETGNENVTERKLKDQAGKPCTLISKKNVYVDD
jgi:PAS domain S-box-containing protein